MARAVIRVWDRWVRLTHWLVASLVIIDLLNEAGANPWHRYFGYAAAALVLMRLAWGVIGTPHARLASMAASAEKVLPYVRAWGSAETYAFAGHNPLGAWMAFTLWGLILLVTVTGWMLQLEQFWGDETLQDAHRVLAYVLAACVVIHVAGAIAASLRHRTNFVKAMITGNKPV